MELRYRTKAQKNICIVEERMVAQLEGNASFLVRAMKGFISNGVERILPVITLEMGEMLGADTNSLVDLAASVEMLHAATQVHDALTDGSLLRFGETLINTEWPPAATVLAGDFVFTIAAKFAADTQSTEVMEMFAKTLATIANGEIAHMFRNGSRLDRKAYYSWIEAKTASMFELATGAAAILSAVDESMLRASRQYGRSIGTAFQIIDDVLDFTAEQAVVGKPICHDLRQGIFTLPVFYYLETHPEDPDLQAIVKQNGFDEESFSRLISSIRKSDAIEHSMQEASQLVQQSLDALEELPNTPQRDTLADLALNSLVRKQ